MSLSDILSDDEATEEKPVGGLGECEGLAKERSGIQNFEDYCISKCYPFASDIQRDNLQTKKKKFYASVELPPHAFWEQMLLECMKNRAFSMRI
ncbi:hypothetical protein GJ496_009433 [Pomphorhynchus laevis]|nr:hypothetical protein GJ496_009433 [Pomphorhynchus laevis]